MKISESLRLKTIVSAVTMATLACSSQVMASASLEEIIVTARKSQESMQDVPVTVSAISAKTIEQYGIDDAFEIGNLVPNLTIQKGSSGAGGMIRLRGVGSSAISAAFDSAIAFNVDGLQVNASRYLFQGMFDMQQIEVLKGPQSLYFGKSASAGVLSMTSKDPGDEFEAGITGSYEFEEDGTKFDAFVSGPLTDTLGARLAVRWTQVDELTKNTAGPSSIGGIAAGGPPYLGPGTSTPKNKWRGEDSLDARLTLDWQPTEKLHSKLKVLVSEYETDGDNYMTDILCVGPTAQDSQLDFIPGFTFPSGLDCDHLDGVNQIGDINEIDGSAAPSRVPILTSDVNSVVLNVDYELADNLTLTSVTGWVDMDSFAVNNASYDVNGTPGGQDVKNTRENFSQELRLSSDFGGKFDFTLGAYYQTREMIFDTWQTSLSPAVIFGPDPVTGFTTSNHKIHTTETDSWSVFLSLSYRPVETVEITAGARHSHEQHKGKIAIPYVHQGLTNTGLFLASGTNISGIDFEDDSLNPEVSIKWQLRDNINLYAAYKTGFKSGGIDNSALPTFTLSNATAGSLAFESETVEGFEAGMKSDLLDNTLRLNVTGYFYTYEDLQTQEFDQVAFNFVTLNAGEVETKGLELEALWITPIEGLTLMTSWAYGDSEYTDDFFVTGETNLIAGTSLENLKGTQIQGNSKWAGNVGFNYEMPVSTSLVMNAGVFSSYRSDYQTGIFTNSPEQKSFWKTDATVSIGNEDGRWELALIAQNLNDKRTINGSIAGRTTTVPDPVTGFRDQIVQISHGRQITLQGKWRF